jgi:tetrahydromethanopterin S-methyltransferase subunit B
MIEAYKAFEAKLGIIFDLIRSKTFVLATDRGTHMYIQRRGVVTVLQLAALRDMLDNLEAIINDVEKSIEEKHGVDKRRAD